MSSCSRLKDLTDKNCTHCPFGVGFILASLKLKELTVSCTNSPYGIYVNTFSGGCFLCVHRAYESSDELIAGGSLLVEKMQGLFLPHRHIIRGRDLSRLILSARFHCDCWRIVNGLGLTTCLVISQPLSSTLGLHLIFVRVFIFRFVGWTWKMPRFFVLLSIMRTCTCIYFGVFHSCTLAYMPFVGAFAFGFIL